MTEHPAPDDCLSRAAAELVTVFEQLGAEHQALTAEAKEITSKERRGTVHRMAERIAQAGRALDEIVSMLATVHGLRVLGIDSQLSKDADGRDYSPLNTLGSPGDTLYEAASHIREVARTLGKAYTQTRKRPGLARARCPRQMRTVFASLRAALDSVRAELVASHDEEAATECTPTLEFLCALEARVCRAVPTQGAGPTADEVVAAIQADPDIARAAASALETTTV
ncbi:hypothetical protein STHAL_33055 [Streptomyces halstedii]|uniref:Uncharacterized protein n=1 Tax=Streptomyces halstedii TaxID=1944 RepID=A0ABS6U189_STRHA|nr:hypothetical protein [Streptomyces halstedii]MBV7674277.1 hypothetical protein [Streptomyces halstedii]